MRGRRQAVAVAGLGVATVLFAWVSAAVVGLVTLRRGMSEGALVLAWALLPALFVALWGRDVGPAAALIGTAVAGAVLRQTVSWAYALLAAVGVGLATAGLLQTVGMGYVQYLLTVLGDFFAELRQQMPAQSGAALADPTAAQVSGLLGFAATTSTVLGLLLARWWQALLYNPGGFREEFHSLRLPRGVATALIAVGLLVSLLGPEYRLWALIFAVPFVVAGFALIHGLAGQRQWSRGVLVVVYLAWLMVDLVKAGLLLAALADSWMNFRRSKAPPPSS